ncbi:ribosomal protein S18 acetylase RimI-like enzyme [Saccharothrix coeruleofusca]|uniref:GNAT family N-acetyltransferase n=1 Tax=Saccharothrix coeruleofusca TaxID=33919 RepID=UPI001AE45631|nr:GNAT family N-acetyltransferase [Saccharothrix coeruleofusca]MBP2338680.1 ribosomal protein S18 acetylase RimI-like enzyme [Saccharothrix coeruleofusca]
MIEVRALEVADWRLWRDLRLAALRDAPEAFGSSLADWQDAGERRWRERLTGSYNAVARLGGEPVGMVSGMPDDEHVELISLWVAPSARGRGVGDALVDSVVRWAAPRRVVLRVAEGNRHALALYLRHGFVESGGGALVRVPA